MLLELIFNLKINCRMTAEEIRQVAIETPHTFDEISAVHDLLPLKLRKREKLIHLSEISRSMGVGIYTFTTKILDLL